ncbi:ABC transporter ATP-binding protein [Paralimibaculum aggregatum]|uniref:ABC transporter ATP-binding protein n=1 Tax=Paralimibaculum aggregatum TaxID=3036245 RepID=A0ABQ6LC56_9RHOB|nr:ABC transporter ATP-binding protein [Limibaculum sp. NKW23]GMG80971.1 ABC transporter ATP-binding protein [Limibaculum sp. NKW23]
MPLPIPFRETIAARLGSVRDELRGGLLWRLVADSAWTHRWSYAAALAMMALVAAMGGAVALTVEQVTDDVFFERNAGALTLVAGWVALIFLVRGAAMYGQTVLLTRIGNRVVADLQARVYAHLLAHGMPRGGGAETSGDLATRMTHNAMAARQVLQLLATRLGVDLMTVLVLLGVMLWQDWRLTLLALVGLPVVLGGVAALVRRVRKIARAEVTLYARIIGAMNETFAGSAVVRAFGLEPRMTARMGEAIDGVRVQADRIAVLKGLVNPLMETTAGLAAAGVILYGGWRVIHEGLAVGTFFSFLTALMMAGDPARRLAQLHVALRQHLAGVAFLYELLDSDHRPPEAPDAPALAVGAGELRFEAVAFAYPQGERSALAGLSFTAPGRKVTALVGPSGGGKSTALALIERFHDPDAGRILIDGQDIRGVSMASLRASIALVTQETFLFDATAGENIAMGREGATHAEVEAAARAAEAHDFIAELPQGYDTPLGEGGARLSGGQRQRLAIARAMLRDAPILLLDEATASLDAETEAAVQAALARLVRDRTVIVIAHRLATVAAADHIVVIAKGAAVEQGPHDALIARGGLYARLAALQGTAGAEAGQIPETLPEMPGQATGEQRETGP